MEPKVGDIVKMHRAEYGAFGEIMEIDFSDHSPYKIRLVTGGPGCPPGFTGRWLRAGFDLIDDRTEFEFVEAEMKWRRFYG